MPVSTVSFCDSGDRLMDEAMLQSAAELSCMYLKTDNRVWAEVCRRGRG